MKSINPVIKGYFEAKKASCFRTKGFLEELLDVYGEAYLIDMIKRISKKKHARKRNINLY